MTVTKPALAFFAGLGLVIFGLAAVPVTVAALGHPLSISCTAASIGYDPGYGISQLAASPSCSIIAKR